MNATIYEAGNGFPSAGEYVKGSDGEVYRIVSTDGRISAGARPSIRAVVELGDWSDVSDETEPYATCTLDEDTAAS